MRMMECSKMYYDLTKGRIGKCLILFALPMIAGNLLQQFYNIADTLIVGRVLGKKCAGSRWFCLYFDDVSDICFSGTEYGFWCSFFDL